MDLCHDGRPAPFLPLRGLAPPPWPRARFGASAGRGSPHADLGRAPADRGAAGCEGLNRMVEQGDAPWR